jgi:hypothetical protein
MKGTAARGATPQDDAAQAAHLRNSPKERAENVMIADLLRNDLSRIAQPHSVRVPRLFHTEALPTVWQMTSDVAATTRTGTRLADVCGAVPLRLRHGRAQGAGHAHHRPARSGPRGVLRRRGPAAARAGGGMHATFNVPIRTVELQGSEARCGIGSGIVWGADANAEWREWAAKRAFVERASDPFDLLETLRLEDGAYHHLLEHRPHGAGGGAFRRALGRHRRAPVPAGAGGQPPAGGLAHAPAAGRRRHTAPRPAWPPRPNPCCCAWRSARGPGRTANSCATRPRAARTTRRLRPRSRACSTPCCGTRKARSPKAPSATSPCCSTAAGSRRRLPAACCPAWAAPRCAKAG